MITVTVNGRSQQFDGEMPLPELIRRLEISFPRIAVAHNGDVLRKEEHDATVIRDGDTVEIVRMVGGGSGGGRPPLGVCACRTAQPEGE
jgi:thiamine biosynthesis protein ThiS